MQQTLSPQELKRRGFRLENDIVVACNGLGFKNILQGGKQWLETHVDVVNNLNVFPVPDGDTGTNMVLTMRSALAEIENVSSHQVGTVAAAAAKGALMGARGNSGVILSQFLQGVAEALAGQVTFTAIDFSRAVARGTELAYQSVIEPVEGTILTVARAVSDAAQQGANNNRNLAAQLTQIVQAARRAQAGTPDLLPVLKKAGVTDSGGQGLVYILEGGLRFFDDNLVEATAVPKTVIKQPSMTGVTETYGYDVQFLLQGEQLDLAQIRNYLDTIGESTLVVGDERLVKVHVHTADPDVPLSYGARLGIVGEVVVEDLDQQARAFVHNLVDEQPSIAVITVASGAGLAHIFESLGAGRIVSGGQSQTPSVETFLTAIRQINADNLLLLPNNKNIVPAAQQAADLSEKNINIVPTHTIPQGITALLAFNEQADLEINIQRMTAAARQVHTIELTHAARDSRFNGLSIKIGDVIGLLNDELVSAGQSDGAVLLDVLARLETADCDMLTIYWGQDRSMEQAQQLAAQTGELYPELEVQVYQGGQPHYQYIISLE